MLKSRILTLFSSPVNTLRNEEYGVGGGDGLIDKNGRWDGTSRTLARVLEGIDTHLYADTSRCFCFTLPCRVYHLKCCFDLLSSLVNSMRESSTVSARRQLVERYDGCSSTSPRCLNPCLAAPFYLNGPA